MSLGGAFDALESLLRQRQERSFAQLSRIAQNQVREAINPNKLIPSFDLSENRDCIRVMVDLPGVMAGDIDVTIDHGVLCIEGSRNIMDPDDAVVVKKQKFTRRYAIDTDVVDCAGATAVLANGVLTFRAPKKERKLQVVRVPVVDGNGTALAPKQEPPIDAEPCAIEDTKQPPLVQDEPARKSCFVEGELNSTMPDKEAGVDKVEEGGASTAAAAAASSYVASPEEGTDDDDAVVSSEESSCERDTRLQDEPPK
jgi:HSP20 family molecular chaperone IbpA